MSINSFRAVSTPRLLSVLRIVVGLLFMMHGSSKIFGIPPSEHAMPFVLFSLMGIGAVLELVGGLLIMLGLFTRPTAFILSGEMAVAYFMFHASKALWPIVNGGEMAVLYAFVFLYFAAAGAGPWSLDSLRRRSGTVPRVERRRVGEERESVDVLDG